MLKKVLIAIYILAVLAFAGFARADVFVNEVQFDNEYLQVHLTGSYTSTCSAQLKPQVIEQVDHSQYTSVLVKIIALPTHELCGQQALSLHNFELIFDIRNLELEANKNYEIKFEGLAHEQIVISLGEDKPVFPISSIEYFGVISKRNSKYFITNAKELIEIRSPIDISDYIGKPVKVMGNIFKYFVQPVDLVGAHISSDKKVNAVMVLSGISL